jgi:hypothetical protein
MDIRIHPEFLERLSKINWFSRVFEPDNISTYISHYYTSSWEETKPLFRDIEWEWATNEARNEFSTHVSLTFPDVFNATWNKLVEETKPFFGTYVEPLATEVIDRHQLGKTFLGCVRWDVMHIIMEEAYRDTNAPVRFYSELLKFYEAGHFPCGWTDGRWPKGRLAVA